VATGCFLFTVTKLNELKESISGSPIKPEENIPALKLKKKKW
jgi:hypothetical protein